jgi:5'-methylthioadenosine phosphorylase
MAEAEIGIIGGSGLYGMEGLTNIEERSIRTPFGNPSDSVIIGRLNGRKVAFLARHGRGHRISPSEINFRANIYAMKELGVERIISVSAVGSMREKIKPGDMVVPDQFFDHTKRRISTFFGEGVVAHVSFADPVCPELADLLFQEGTRAGAVMHKGGTYLCIEGPQFSTRGESNIYRGWQVDVIGMTNVTEAKLAREAEICYSTLAMATDYDCWHTTEEAVSAEAVIKILMKNVETSKKIIKGAICGIPKDRKCHCGDALKDSIMTKEELISEEIKERLKPILRRYFK